MDEACEQDRAFTHEASDPLARETRICARRACKIESPGIAIFEIVRDRRFRPKHQPRLVIARRSQLRGANELLFKLACIFALFLRNQRLDQRKGNFTRAVFARDWYMHRACKNCGKPCQSDPPRAAGKQGDQSGNHDYQPGKRICAKPRQQRSNSRVFEPAQQHQAKRRPRIAGEDPAAQPFGHDPCACKGEHEACQAAIARDQVRSQGSQGRINRQVKAQQRHCQPAKELRHFRLVSESSRDPVIGDCQMRKAEQPPDDGGAFPALRAPQQCDQPSHASEPDWPNS